MPDLLAGSIQTREQPAVICGINQTRLARAGKDRRIGHETAFRSPVPELLSISIDGEQFLAAGDKTRVVAIVVEIGNNGRTFEKGLQIGLPKLREFYGASG